MTPRQLLSPQARAALFDPPREVRAIVRHYTFSREDLTLIRQRRREANRLGFAVHLAYLRFPGRVLGPHETPPAPLLVFLADQLRLDPKAFGAYAQRGETRREHLAELQAYLGVRPFGREDARPMARIALGEAMGTDVARPLSAPWWPICGRRPSCCPRRPCSKRLV
jgi:TnpA family transposase